MESHIFSATYTLQTVSRQSSVSVTLPSMYCEDQITCYLSFLTLYTAVVGTVRSQLGSGRHGQANYVCSKNVNFDGNRSTLSIAMELLLLRSIFLFYQNVFRLKLNCFHETAESCGLGENVFEKWKKFGAECTVFPP